MQLFQLESICFQEIPTATRRDIGELFLFHQQKCNKEESLLPELFIHFLELNKDLSFT